MSPPISAVEAIPIAVSGSRDFAISEGRTRRHVSVILRLVTEEPGLEGFGEVVCAPPGKPEELPGEICWAIREVIAPAIVGLPATARGLAGAKAAAVLKGRAWTKAALDVALHDLQAKALGISAAELLGGRRSERVPVMGTVIGIGAADAMAAEAAALKAAGYRCVKIKLGETVAGDIARVAAVREALGPGIALRVDANDHYRPAEALRLIRAIERYDLEHVEQPIGRGDLLGMAELRRAVGVPLMTDDMVATPEEAMTVIRLGAADRMKVKVTKHGLSGARLIVEMLAAAGMTAVLGHVFEMGLAAAAETLFAGCTEGLSGAHEIGSMRPMGSDADIVTTSLDDAETGFLRVPEGPGLGVALDWERIEAQRLTI